ncbi:ragulator complex protein LAMTOR1-like protein, partial [Camelus ferus]
RRVNKKLSRGCCSSSENADSDQDQEERKPQLEPSGAPSKAFNGAEPSHHGLPSARADEQALLSSILTQTARSIIDMSAADTQGVEQPEYMGQTRQYNRHLVVLSSSRTPCRKLPPGCSILNAPTLRVT